MSSLSDFEKYIAGTTAPQYYAEPGGANGESNSVANGNWIDPSTPPPDGWKKIGMIQGGRFATGMGGSYDAGTAWMDSAGNVWGVGNGYVNGGKPFQMPEYTPQTAATASGNSVTTMNDWLKDQEKGASGNNPLDKFMSVAVPVGLSAMVGSALVGAITGGAGAAEGWVSAEGGAGYAGGMAADAAGAGLTGAAATGLEAAEAGAGTGLTGAMEAPAGAANGWTSGYDVPSANGEFGDVKFTSQYVGPGGGAETLGGPATTSTGTPGAATNTQSLAQQTLGPGAPSASPQSILQPGDGDLYASGAGSNTAAGAAPGAGAPAEAGKGIVGRIMSSFDKMSPSERALITAGGTAALGGLGGAGQALLQKQIAEKNIQAAKDLQSQQVRDRLALQSGTTAQTAANAYTGAIPFGPAAGPKVLYRADGTPVFTPGTGLIGRAMPARA